MAERKTDDNQAANKITDVAGVVENSSNVQAENNSIAVGGITVGGDMSGNITIGHGFTAEQVSVLITKITSKLQPKPFDGSCPYKGLDIFEEEDAGLFFGRERLIKDLISRVNESHAVFITGPSGSGKSSLARAGLIHALRQGALRDLHSERWLYETMKPGREPINELARVVAGLARTLNAGEDIRSKGGSDVTVLAQWCEIALRDGRDKRAVILVDQFEEVFTQVIREEERQTFLKLLTYAANVENGRIILLCTMRSDFISNCAAYPALNELLNRNFVQIGAMQPEELVSAIARPSLQVGLHIDPDLISKIINEMEGEPGSLPLMQFALKDLFGSQQEDSGVIALTLNDYLARGGIHKALERHADAEFNKLTKAEQALTENLFKGLVEIGRNVPDTRRIAHFEEFASPDVSFYAFESVVRRLADARLISTDEDKVLGRTITLAHEKLIESWPWLRQLVNDNRTFIQLHNQILEDAIEWEKHGKDKSYLYSGSRLTSVQKTTRDYEIKNEKARLFLFASKKVRNRNLLQLGFIALLLLMMGIAVYVSAIRPLFESDIHLQPIDLGGGGVNALQAMENGTVYAGMYNYQLKAGGPCLARLTSGTGEWQTFGPKCAKTVMALWVNPLHPEQIYFSQSGEAGIYRSQDGGQNWKRVGIENGLPLENVSSVIGTGDGLMFAADYMSKLGVYRSTDQGNTWVPLRGSPAEIIYTLTWHSPEGLLVGGNGGVWLWEPNGEWTRLIALDITEKDQSVFSIVAVPAEELTILAGGEEGIYVWKEGDPGSNTVRNDTVKMAYSLALVNKPEPYIIALTFPNSKIWRMTTDGGESRVMKEIGSDGLPLIAQEKDVLRLWIGTVDRLYMGEPLTKILEIYRKK